MNLKKTVESKMFMRRTVYETTWTDCRHVVEVQFGPGHDCGRLTGYPEVDRDEGLSSWITSV